MGLLEWWNFLFAAPLLAGVVLAVVFVLSGAAGHDGAGHGHDAAGEGHDAGHSGEDEGIDVLGWFGIGRGVSLGVMLSVLLASWGFLGLVLNVALEPFLRFPVLFVPLAAIGALLGAALVGRTFAGAFSKLTDTSTVTSIHAGGLVGCSGTSVFDVTTDAGSANIRDPFGNIHRVSVRASGSQTIAPNTAVTVLEYRDGVYIVQIAERVDKGAFPT
jgi:hypothetical protein